MYCKYCGKQITPGSMVCPYCGQEADALSGGTGFWDLTEKKSSQRASLDPIVVSTEQNSKIETIVPAQAPTSQPLSGKRPIISGKMPVILLVASIALLIMHCITFFQINQIESRFDIIEQRLGGIQNNMIRLTEAGEQTDSITSTTPEGINEPQTAQVPSSDYVSEESGLSSDLEEPLVPQDLTVDVTLGNGIDGIQLELDANVQPRDILENENQIKWWKGLDGGDIEPLYEGTSQATGQSQYYALTSASGNPERYVFYTIEFDDGREYKSELVYVLNEVVSIETKYFNGQEYLVPAYMKNFESRMGSNSFQGYWEWKTSSRSEWSPLLSEYEEYISFLPVSEIDPSHQYRFIVQYNETILGIANYNGKDE